MQQTQKKGTGALLPSVKGLKAVVPGPKKKSCVSGNLTLPIGTGRP